jgi:DNA end-binding protein Ku
MAQALVDSMTVAWEPDKYRDEYRAAVMELIEQKAKNKKIDVRPATPHPTTNVVDLVKVLQESLNRSQSVRVKRSSNGSRRRNTSSIVRQKRRAAA